MNFPKLRLIPEVIFLLLLAAPAFAAGPYPYLPKGRPDALALLAPPPLAGSAEQAADLASAFAIFSARTPAEEAAAKAEENLSLFTFAPAIGANNFQTGRFPKTEALFAEVENETGPVIYPPILHYQRLRPFQVDRRMWIGQPDTSASYPSGHATLGAVEAALLAELIPQHADAILEAGRNIGWHRVLTGRQYPTDIYASRVLARAIVRELKANPAFQRDFAECAAELAAGKLSP